MNTKEKGDISVAVILSALLKARVPVLTPFGDKERYDLVIDLKGRFKRIQCKTGQIRNGCVLFRTYSLSTCKGDSIARSYTANEIDLFMIYCPENEKIYILDVNDVPTRICYLRLEASKNGQKQNIRLASDHEFVGFNGKSRWES
jgi:hypothetical protein